ncbi:MAG TPA: ATP-binding protein [Azospira sp.]|nr:ATP-binding protein [Azospira sp.]
MPAAIAPSSPSAPLPGPAGQPLARLVMLRRVEVLAQGLVLVLATGWLRIPLEVLPMAMATVGLGLFNLYTQWRLSRPRPVADGEYFCQLLPDVLALTLLLYYAGGSANPFVSLFLLPLTIAAATLPGRYIWAMAGISLGAYTFLMFFNLPLPPPQGDLARLDELLARASGVAPEHAGHGGGFALHVLGMWFNFLVSALIVAYFLSRLAATLRQRERELGEARQREQERALRHEQILALGTLAAGAAHKLGTPLSTMAVVLRDLELEYGQAPGLGEDLTLLRQQVDQCKRTLTQVLASAGAPRDGADAPPAQPLAQWLNNLLDGWRVLRPRVRVDYQHQPEPLGEPLVRAEPSLEQALVNILDNAADASPDGVEVRSRVGEGSCVIEFLDWGPGLEPALAQRLGQAFVSTKEDPTQAGGAGIGLFLTRATLERFGGRLELANRPPAEGPGARCRITLPLTALTRDLP